MFARVFRPCRKGFEELTSKRGFKGSRPWRLVSDSADIPFGHPFNATSRWCSDKPTTRSKLVNSAKREPLLVRHLNDF